MRYKYKLPELQTPSIRWIYIGTTISNAPACCHTEHTKEVKMESGFKIMPQRLRLPLQCSCFQRNSWTQGLRRCCIFKNNLHESLQAPSQRCPMFVIDPQRVLGSIRKVSLWWGCENLAWQCWRWVPSMINKQENNSTLGSTFWYPDDSGWISTIIIDRD